MYDLGFFIRRDGRKEGGGKEGKEAREGKRQGRGERGRGKGGKRGEEAREEMKVKGVVRDVTASR